MMHRYSELVIAQHRKLHLLRRQASKRLSILLPTILLIAGCSQQDEGAKRAGVESNKFEISVGTVTAGDRKSVTVRLPLGLPEATPVWYVASSAPYVHVSLDRKPPEPTLILEAGEDLEIPMEFCPPNDFTAEHLYTYVVFYRENPADRTEKLRFSARVCADVQTAD